ncbi:MAG: cupredoxin domain-containing protein [Myxococcota bacterium]
MLLGRTASRRRTALGLLAAGLGLACATPPWLPGAAGSVEGRVLQAEGARGGEWVVVYLDGPELADAPAETGDRVGPALLRSRAGDLLPPVLAVSAGQPIALRSADGLHHRFFSSSRPQGFEPVDVPGGESRQLSLEQPGVVRVYCSLHPREEGTIVVAPSRHFSALKAPGG